MNILLCHTNSERHPIAAAADWLEIIWGEPKKQLTITEDHLDKLYDSIMKPSASDESNDYTPSRGAATIYTTNPYRVIDIYNYIDNNGTPFPLVLAVACPELNP